MSEYAQQPSAHGIKDKAYRKLVFGHHSHATKRGSDTAQSPRGGAAATGKAASGSTTPRGGNLADALERARHRRHSGEKPEESSEAEKGDGEVSDGAPAWALASAPLHRLTRLARSPLARSPLARASAR